MYTYATTTTSGRHNAPLRRVLITGGSGFLGFRLATRLVVEEPGVEVLLLDLAPPPHPLPPGVIFIPGSVADPEAVDSAVAGLCVGSSDSCNSAVWLGKGYSTGAGDGYSTGPGGSGSVSPGKGHPSIHSGSSGIANHRDGVSASVSGCGSYEARANPQVDAVFHVASYGMSGRELRDKLRIEPINVAGTKNVIEACVRYGVSRLVYVSTCNVIFVGQEIVGGTESAPYPPTSAYKDAYSATKAAAEKLVRAANGTSLGLPGRRRNGGKVTDRGAESGSVVANISEGHPAHAVIGGDQRKGWDERWREGEEAESASCSGRPQTDGFRSRVEGRVLSTCCVRSTGIWGPGETRHQPRVIGMVRRGLFVATFGNPANLSDWIHVDNLVQVLLRAERALRPPHRSAAGQVYYASDGAPINNFEHFRPFIEGLGYRYPKLNVPYSLMYGIAAAIEYGWPLLQYIVRDPPLTRMEVDKCGVNHWFDISKARQELGYEPVQYDRMDVVRQMDEEGWSAATWVVERQRWRAVLGSWISMVMLAGLVVLMAKLLSFARYSAGHVDA